MKRTLSTTTSAIYLSIFIILFVSGCEQQQRSQPDVISTAVQKETQPPIEPPPLPTIVATPFSPPIAEYIQNQALDFSIPLNQPVALRRDQRVMIEGTDISLLHTTEIEFECPSDQDCETALIAFDYFTLFDGETIVHQQEWEQEMHLGEYIITTAKMWHDDNYDKHQFEIILNIRHQEMVAAAEATRTADPNHVQINTNCSDAGISDVSHYFSTAQSIPELHVFGIYRASRDQFDLTVERVTETPLILFLSANDATEWHIETADAVEIGSIILNGRGAHTISGVEGVPIIDKTGLEHSFTGYVTRWSGDIDTYNHGLSPKWVYELEAFTHTSITSFTGCYTATETTLR